MGDTLLSSQHVRQSGFIRKLFHFDRIFRHFSIPLHGEPSLLIFDNFDRMLIDSLAEPAIEQYFQLTIFSPIINFPESQENQDSKVF
jgi:hypothetical protein